MRTVLYDDSYLKMEVDEDDDIPIGTFKFENLDINIARYIVAKRLEIMEYPPYATIVDIRNVKHTTKEARDFLASEEGCEGVIATAIIIDSPLGAMLANFYMAINRPLRPVKMFTEMNKSKQWLKQFLSK